MGEWPGLVISFYASFREAGQISLIVDELEISTTAPGDSIELNVYDSLFIGKTIEHHFLVFFFK